MMSSDLMTRFLKREGAGCFGDSTPMPARRRLRRGAPGGRHCCFLLEIQGVGRILVVFLLRRLMNSLPAHRGEGVEGEATASGGAARSLEDLTSRRLRL